MIPIIPVSQSVLQEITVVGSISPSQLPVFVGSGPSHNIGAVPDPGAVAGSNRYLCETGLWTIPPGITGTVSSVGLSLPSIFNVTGSPVTSNGTLSATYTTQIANTIFSGPTTGSNATPTFRTLVSADIPSLDFGKVTTGVVPVAQGGTGASTAAAARTNLSTAALGVNADITSLTAVTSLASPSSLTLSSAAANSITISPGSSGILHVIGASNVTNVMRLRAGVAANNTTSLLFYGANAATDLWAIGNAVSTLNTARQFEIYDVPNALTRFSVTNTGIVQIPTGDLQISATVDSQTRVITNRSYNYLSSNIEAKLTYSGSGVAGTTIGTIPNANLGTLTFQGTTNALIYTTGSAPLMLGTNSFERIRITETGNVGIAHVFPSEKLEVAGNAKAVAFIGDGSQLTGFIASQIPNHDASKITTGTFSSARIPNLDAAIVTTGTFSTSRIPALDTSIITSGTLSVARGGTGGISVATAVANLLPSQTGNSGKTLTTDGTNVSWGVTAGTVTSFAAGNLSPLFTTSVSTSTTTPSLTFTLGTSPGFSWFGNNTGFNGAPTFQSQPLPPALLPLNVRHSVTALAMTSTTSVDWTAARVFTGTLTNNITLTFSGADGGQTIRIRLTQAAGLYTVIWPAAVRWTSGSDPVMTKVNGQMDLYTITYDGVNYLGEFTQGLT